MPAPSLTTAGKITLGVLSLAVLGTAAGMGIVSAATAPPPPTITSGPANPTTSASAALAFKDSQSGASFTCSLDTAAFGACTSPKNYGGLADGSHTFRVAAQVAGSSPSTTAAYTWVIDGRAPAITIGFPTGNGVSGFAAYGAGCTPAGICGSATDGSGVATVRVSILQSASTKYWNGTSFTSTAEVFNPAALAAPGAGTTIWRYALSLPPDGSYMLRVAAADGLGNTTPAGSYVTATFGVDTVSPPVPVLTGGPNDPPVGTNATFHATDTENGVTLQCSLDGAAFTSCGNPANQEYNNLAPGDHVFRVRAADVAGNLSAATSFAWTIVLKETFPIAGSLTLPFYPGRTLPLNLSFTNANHFDLKVVGVSIGVQHATIRSGQSNPGCDGPTNMVVSQGFSGPVMIPASSTRSLQDLGIAQSQWPQMTMPDLPVNQDACKSTTFTFTYSGTGTKA